MAEDQEPTIKQFTRYTPEVDAEQSRPTTRYLDDTQVTYDQLMERYSQEDRVNPYLENLSREEFEGMARQAQEQNYDQYVAENNQQFFQEQERYQIAQAKQAEFENEQEWQRKVDSWQQGMEELGQGQDAADKLGDIADVAATLLALEGDKEEDVAAREAAAAIFSQYREQLAPHIRMRLGEEWWLNNYERINENLPDELAEGWDAWRPGDKRGFWGSLKNNLGVLAGGAAESRMGQYAIQALSTTEQAATTALGGFRAALDPNDGVSAADALKFTGSTLAQMPVDLAAAIAPGLSSQYADGPRLLTTSDGRTLSFDLNDDGTVNLREAVGRTNELSNLGERFASGLETVTGGTLGTGTAERFVGLADTVGLAAIDPLSWVSMGATGRARVGLRTLAESQDSAANAAFRQLRNGVPLSQQDEIFQVGARAAIAQDAYRAGLRQNLKPSRLSQLRRTAKDADELLQDYIERQVELTEAAINRGAMPGIRIGGNTVLPTRRLLNALNLIDSSAGDVGRWSLQAPIMQELENVDELVEFIHRYDGGEIPDYIRDQMRTWDAVANEMADTSNMEWIDEALAATGNPETYARTFDEIEAFGRQMFDDRVVNSWREHFDQMQLNPSRRLPQTMDDAPRNLRYTQGEVLPEHSMLDNVAVEGLDDAALARVQANLDIIEQPRRWINEDLGLTGRNVLYGRDTLAGRLYTRMADAFSPRARIRRAEDLGDTTARQLDQAATEADSLRRLAHQHADMLDINAQRRSGLVERVERELGEGDAWQRRVDAALSDPDGIESHVARLMDEGHVATAQLVGALDTIGRDVLEMSARSGVDIETLANQKLTRNLDVGAEESAEAIMRANRGNTELEDLFQRMGVTGEMSERAPSIRRIGQDRVLGQEGYLRPRTYAEDVESIYAVNAQAREDLISAGIAPEVAEGFTLYNENPVTSAMMRSRAAQEARVYSDMLGAMTNLRAPNGRPLGYLAETGDDKAAALLRRQSDEAAFGGDLKFREIPLPNGGAYYIERRIAEEIDRTRRIVGSTVDRAAIKELANAHNNVWAAYATVMNPAFHARNAVGNAFNMFLAGVNDPRVFRDAFQVQSREAQVARLMTDEAISFDEALGRLNFSAADETVLRDIRNFDLASSNRVTDLLNEYDPLNAASGERFVSAAPVRAGREVGNAIEGNARIALYLDGINKGMSPTQASARVREFLFDYADLTEFEAERLRMISRFYTFTRKNTALQARIIGTQPGRVINAERLAEQFQDNTMAMFGYTRDEEGEMSPPEWMPFGAIYEKDGVTGFGANIDTPFRAFIETTNSLSAMARTPLWMIDIAAGREDAREDAGQSIRDSLQLFSGGPVELIKTATEVATGQDMFTGRDLEFTDRTFIDRLTRFTDILFPVGSTIDRHLEGFGAYEALGVMQGEDEDGDGEPDFPDRVQGRDRLINLVTGMQLYYDQTDPESIAREEMETMIREMDSALRQAQYDVPRDERLTVDDLVDMGQLNSRNDVLIHILYTGRTPANFTQEDEEWLDRMLPEAIQRELGIDIAGDRTAGETASDLTPEEAARKTRERIAVIEAMGIQVDPALRDNIIKYSLGLTMGELENDIGAEAFRTWNSYRDKALEEGDTEAAAQANRDFTQEVLSLMEPGRTLEDFVEANPLMTYFDRDVENMRQAGYTEQQIADEIIDGLSRERRAIVFGEDSLDSEFSYELYTDDELEKMEKKIKQENAQMEWLWMYQFGRMPTQEERNFYLAQVFFTSPEQDRVGIDRYSPPRRENVTSDETYIGRQTQEAGLLDQLAGTEFLENLGQ